MSKVMKAIDINKMEKFFLYVILCQLILSVHFCNGEDRPEGWIDGLKLSELLEKLVDEDGLNHGDLQQVFDDNSDLFTKQNIDGSSVVKQIADSLGQRFQGAVNAVKAIKATAENEYHTYDSTNSNYEECCNVDDSRFEMQAYLKRRVNLNDICYRVSADAPHSPKLPLSDKLMETMKKNYEDNDRLYWQYFGTEEGIFTTYPSRKAQDCDSYDPRFRPAYVETATPVPKDIVIVLDRSESMTNAGIWGLAQEAAKTVLGTLNPNDRMGLIYFSDEARAPIIVGNKKCMGVELAFATPGNKEDMTNYVDEIDTQGGTRYIPALKKAYKLLNSSSPIGDKRQRDKAILFLTDGKPTDASKEKILEEINSHSSMGVIILTIGLGNELGQDALDLLQEMSTQSVGNPGIFKVVPDASNLRYQMGSYYNALTKPDPSQDKVIITAPYVDYSGLGLITSICTPIYYNGTLKGVACIDVNMLDLIADVEYFEQGKQSYTFIIDGTGRVIIHPLLPQPTDLLYFNWDPVFIDAHTLERNGAADFIINSMKRGEAGTREGVYTKLIQSRGQSSRDGVTTEQVETNYYWEQIPNTNFSVCVAIPTNEKHLEISDVGDRTICDNFISDRIDLYPLAIDTCVHIGRYASRDGLGVKFTPAAFLKPQNFINRVEDKDAISLYKLYMEGEDAHGENLFKPSVRPAVALAYQVQSSWFKNSPYLDNIVWRYVGMSAGAFLIYPAVGYDKSYDHTKRPWYRKALAHPNDVVLSAPYWDAGGAGIVTTLSKTLLEGRTTGHSLSDSIVGVIGMDFNLNTIRNILYTAAPSCQNEDYSCFLVDTSGYLVYHDDFVGGGRDQVEFVHIAKKEPHIAEYLIQGGHLMRQSCDDFEKKDTYHTWKLNIQQTVIQNLNGVPSFDAERISGTNIYVFIKNNQKSSARCECPDKPSDIETCALTDDDSCECPCKTETPFQYCQNTFSLTLTDSLPICVPDTSQTDFSSPITNEDSLIASLGPCYEVDCSEKKDEGSCVAVHICSWCSISGDSSCNEKSLCPITPTEGSGGVNSTQTGGGGSNVGAIAGGVVGGLVVIGIIVAVVIVILVLRKRKAEKSDPTYPGNQIQFHPSSTSEINYSTRPQPPTPVQQQPPMDLYNSSQASSVPSYHDRGHDNQALRLSVGDTGYRQGNHENIYHDLDLVRDARNSSYDPQAGQRLSQGRGEGYQGRGESYLLPTDNSGGSTGSAHARPPSNQSVETPDIYLNPRASIHATNNIDPTDRQYVM